MLEDKCSCWASVTSGRSTLTVSSGSGLSFSLDSDHREYVVSWVSHQELLKPESLNVTTVVSPVLKRIFLSSFILSLTLQDWTVPFVCV